jgi:hypothetical protein
MSFQIRDPVRFAGYGACFERVIGGIPLVGKGWGFSRCSVGILPAHGLLYRLFWQPKHYRSPWTPGGLLRGKVVAPQEAIDLSVEGRRLNQEPACSRSAPAMPTRKMASARGPARTPVMPFRARRSGPLRVST